MLVMGIPRRRWKPRWAKSLFVSSGTVRPVLTTDCKETSARCIVHWRQGAGHVCTRYKLAWHCCHHRRYLWFPALSWTNFEYYRLRDGRSESLAHTAAEAILSFFFVDYIYISIRPECSIRQVAVYVMLAYDTNWYKDVLDLWVNETESKHAWMQIFDELKARGIEDLGILSLGILSIDGVSGLEEGAKAIFPNVTVQRCIVHLVRNSIRYIPRKQWSAFTKQLKGIYGAVNVEEARRGSTSLNRTGRNIPVPSPFGKTTSNMLSSSLITAVPYVRSCTRPMLSKA